MATIKSKMLDELATYVGLVRDGVDAMSSDEDIAAKAYDIMASVADDLLEADDFRALTDLIFTEVEEPVADEVWAKDAGLPLDAAAALRVLAKALGVTL